MTLIVWTLNAEGWGEDVVAVSSCPSAAAAWIKANPPEKGWYWLKKVPALNSDRVEFEERLACRFCGLDA